MAETLDPENAAFWLPSSFLSDDEDNMENNDECLFGFDPQSSFDSSLSSTQTEREDTIYNNNDDLIAELTRHLARSSLHDSPNEKPWNYSTSPQSTLTGFGSFTIRSGPSSNGSPNGPSSRVPSPPLTPPPKNDAAWELLYEAAAQVARLKINQQNRGFLSAPRNVSLPNKPLNHHHHHNHNSFFDFAQYEQLKRTANGNFYSHNHNHNHNHNLQLQQQRRSSNGGPLGLPQSAWPPLRPNNHNHHHLQPNGGPALHSAFLNGPGLGPMAGIKRQSTGTGVFLPRRVGTTTQPRTKPAGCSSMWLPTRPVDTCNMESQGVNNSVNVNPRARFCSGMLSEQEILMAKRNAVMERRRRSLMRNDEISLPSDWTY